ncbi:uncharacterized protein AFUA_5G03170 [Aspergillus fumigatus Af293]|uniref:Uncharacterized protein n=2 Tax=Aspergillus fumigatus TaxID=746128 RepID=Q4WEI9_ASPFU|nr:hypothetical protein AFUA_5G03170 [Aspergillus fumigatus Af293]EAL85988.1 hypothetical protein AFUA_5G03170 [Aspergillus fumigatus Af293]EDP51166.1 hypothetical protein AFUB_051680 [Aspergillus fumigatus A1163]
MRVYFIGLSRFLRALPLPSSGIQPITIHPVLLRPHHRFSCLFPLKKKILSFSPSSFLLL